MLLERGTRDCLVDRVSDTSPSMSASLMAQLGEALDLVLQSHVELDVLILHLGGV
jgi:hypothetical protein